MKNRSWSIAAQRSMTSVDLRSIRFQMLFVASHKPMSNIYAAYIEEEKSSRTLADIRSACYASYDSRVLSSLVTTFARVGESKLVAVAQGILVILPRPAEGGPRKVTRKPH